MGIIQHYLRSSDSAVYRDQKIFTQWARKEITTEECKKMFFENNGFPKEIKTQITDTMFTDWLNGIGYFRRTW